MNGKRMVRVAGIVSVALACAGVVSAQPKATAGGGMEQRKPSPAFPAKEGSPIQGLQGFSVVLVLGDQQGGQTADNIPQAARKALADMKDFLPYKNYHLLDAAWILGSSRSANRMRGPDDVEYEVSLSAFGAAPDTRALRVEFVLREPGDTPRPAATGEMVSVFREQERLSQLMKERESLEKEVARLDQSLGDKHPTRVNADARLSELKREVAELEGKGRAVMKRGGQIISTTFSMDIGETVVVGTSRLRGGDKALITLLTAVPKK